MEIFKTIKDTKKYIREKKDEKKSIGFVPTMGALHEGHLSLIRKAVAENDIVACSIFVNPVQFNKKEDLKNYPRNLEKDIRKLSGAGCDILFNPEVDEMYPEPVVDKYNFGYLEKLMEGKYRRGHFNGVAVVVRKLFEIIEPERAYFGLKDYQQLIVIKTMTENLGLPVQIIPCTTMREKDGLAMSSRNFRLTGHERKIAPVIYRVLKNVKEKAGTMPVEQLTEWAVNQINKFEELNVEYLEIADAGTLLPFKDWNEAESAIVCSAVYLGEIRLIDNLILF